MKSFHRFFLYFLILLFLVLQSRQIKSTIGSLFFSLGKIQNLIFITKVKTDTLYESPLSPLLIEITNWVQKNKIQNLQVSQAFLNKVDIFDFFSFQLKNHLSLNKTAPFSLLSIEEPTQCQLIQKNNEVKLVVC